MRSISKTDRVFLLLLLSAALSAYSLYFFHNLGCPNQSAVTQSGCCGTMETIGCGAEFCADFCVCVSGTHNRGQAFLPKMPEINFKKNLKLTYAAVSLFFSEGIRFFSHSPVFFPSTSPPGGSLAVHIPSTILLI